MATRDSSAVSSSWTEWEWNDERQKLRRTLVDRRGNVLRVQFGERAAPRYPPPGNSLPQPPESVAQQVAAGNYTYDSTAVDSPQSGIGQREEPRVPDHHRSQDGFSFPSPTSAPSSLPNSGEVYVNSAVYQNPQARFGFPEAQNAGSGFSDQYGASYFPQIAHFGFRPQYESEQSYHETSDRQVTLHQSDTQFLPGSNVQPGNPNQYSSAAGPRLSPSWHQPESAWLPASHLQSGSAGFLSKQDTQSGFSGAFAAPPGNIAPSGPGVDSEPASQKSYPETSFSSGDINVNGLTQGVQKFSLSGQLRKKTSHTNPVNAPSQEAEEPQKPSTRAPPIGYDRPDSVQESSNVSDMARTQLHSRHQSDAHRHRRGRGHRKPTIQPTDSDTRERGNKDRWPTKELLDERLQIHESKEFLKGRVLITLWSEPIGNKGTKEGAYNRETGAAKPSKYGEDAYHSVRRFVIAKSTVGHSLCVPILTYGGQGTAKSGAKYKDHAMIYTGDEVPEKLKGEKKLLKKPLRMENYSERDKLVKESRLNYRKLYTIEHNIRVCFIGEIHKDSQHRFFTEVKRAFEEDEELGEPEDKLPLEDPSL